MRGTDAFAEAGAMVVLITDQFLVAYLGFPGAVFQPCDCDIGCRPIIFRIHFLWQFDEQLVEIFHFLLINLDSHSCAPSTNQSVTRQSSIVPRLFWEIHSVASRCCPVTPSPF